MIEDTISALRLNWSAERSALVAAVLHRSGGLRRRMRLRVHGESMLPSLWPGDVVEIASCSLEDVRPGEILLAQRDRRLFLHRVVATRPDGFVLRGDSMPGPDPLFPVEALLGRLVDAADKRRGRAALSRALGLLLCHCGVARRFALRLHSHNFVRNFARKFQRVANHA